MPSGAGHRCKQGAQTLRAAGAPARVEQAGSGLTQMFGLGGFAELALVHENQVVKIPAGIPFAQAAVMACSTLTGAGAVFNCAKVAPGESVVILGAGGVGLNAINAARIAGAQRIIAVDLAEDKLELARRFGATHTVNAASQDPVDAVLELSGGGVHHAFEMIGFPATSLRALRMTRTGGHAYLIGLHRPGSTLEIDVMADVIGPQRSLHGLYMGSSALSAMCHATLISTFWSLGAGCTRGQRAVPGSDQRRFCGDGLRWWSCPRGYYVVLNKNSG